MRASEARGSRADRGRHPRWPEDEEQRRKLADERMPRLLRIEAGASPPELSTSSRTGIGRFVHRGALARRDTVQVRASRRAREPVLDGSVLRVGQQWVAVPPACRGRAAVVGARSCARPSWSPPSPPGRQLGRHRGESRAPLARSARSACSCTACGSGLAARGAAGLPSTVWPRPQMQRRRKKGVVQASADRGAAVPATKH